jgi:hypothetical protein
MDQRGKQPPRHTPANPRSKLVAACCGQLVSPWSLGTGPVIEQIAGRRSGTGWFRRIVRAGDLFRFSFGLRKVAVGQSFTRISAFTLEDRGASSIFRGGRKGFLLRSRHCFPQPRRKTEESSAWEIALIKASLSCFSITPTAEAPFLSTLL